MKQKCQSFKSIKEEEIFISELKIVLLENVSKDAENWAKCKEFV